MANTYTYHGPGERWVEGQPTAEDRLNVARENADHLHEALNTIMDTDLADGVLLPLGGIDLNGTNLIFDADGDSKLYAAADDVVALNLNNAEAFRWLVGGMQVPDDTWIGLGVSAGRITFDATATPDTITVSDASLVANGIVNIATATNWQLGAVAFTGSMANLNTLRDDSMADALHRHSELSASDGTPNPAVQVDAAGNVAIGTAMPWHTNHLSIGGDLGTGTEVAQGFYNTSAAATGNRIDINYYFKSTNWTQDHAAQFSVVSTSTEWGDGYFAWSSNNQTGALSLTERMRLTGAGWLGIGTASPNGGLHVTTKSIIGADGTAASAFAAGPSLLVAQGTNDDNAIELQSSDVAHGMTDIATTSAWGVQKKLDATGGGVNFWGLTEVTKAFQVAGLGVTDDTTKTNSATSYVTLGGAKKVGATIGSPGTDANIVSIVDLGSANGTKWIVDQEGDTWQTGGATFSTPIAIGGATTATRPISAFSGSSEYVALLDNAHAAPFGLVVDFSASHPDDNTQIFLKCEDDTAVRCYIYSDGDLANHDGTYGTISDARLKTTVAEARSYWEDWKALKWSTYYMVTDAEKLGEAAPKRFGLMAQDVAEVFPSLAVTSSDGTMWIKSSIIHEIGGRVLQEALGRIEQLEGEIATLKEAA